MSFPFPAGKEHIALHGTRSPECEPELPWLWQENEIQPRFHNFHFHFYTLLVVIVINKEPIYTIVNNSLLL